MASAIDLLSPPTLATLIDAGPVALFVDFDGTLVEIADTPSAIRVPFNLTQNLAALSDRMHGRLALISGRTIEDLESHLGSLQVACAGSHGADLRNAGGAATGRPPPPLEKRVIRQVQAFAAETGADFEAKVHGAALHSRANPRVEDQCAQFLDRLAAEHGLVVKRGKFVAELVRQGADKGAAVRRFMASPPFAGAMPVFVGDDITDEDGFEEVVRQGGFAITVGPRDSRLAVYGLADPAEVHHWLGL